MCSSPLLEVALADAEAVPTRNAAYFIDVTVSKLGEGGVKNLGNFRFKFLSTSMKLMQLVFWRCLLLKLLGFSSETRGGAPVADVTALEAGEAFLKACRAIREI
jgi:hypothetical protein